MDTGEVRLIGSASVNDIGKITCHAGYCSHVIKGVRKGDLTVHPDGRVTLLSHEKAQEKFEAYQKILKEKPDCSAVGYWNAGLTSAAKAFKTTRSSKTTRKVNKVILAYHIILASSKGIDAVWEHDKKCSYFKSIEGMITQITEASTVPIAWIEPKNQYRDPIEENLEKLQEKKRNVEILEKPASETKEEAKVEVDKIPESRVEIPEKSASETKEEAKVEVDKIPESRTENLDDKKNLAFSVIHLNRRQPKKSSIEVKLDLGEDSSLGAVLNPMKLEPSAFMWNSNITEEFGTSLTLSPANLKKSAVGATFGDDSLNVGINSSLDGRHSQVKIGGEIEGVSAAVRFDAKRPLKRVIHLESSQKISGIPCSSSTDLNLRNPRKTTVEGEAVVPVYGVPLKIGGKLKLGKPQDAQAKVSLPTGFFDKILPKEIKLGDVQILSFNLKKMRSGLKKFTGIGKSKKKKALKRVQKQVAAIEAERERIRKMREQWFCELTDWVVQKVDEKYAPIISQEIRDLNHDLEQFVEEISELPMLNLQEIEREPLSLNSDKLIWNETKWKEFFVEAAGALFEINEENKALSQLVIQLEELSNSFFDCVVQFGQISEQYQEVNKTFEETQKLLQILVNSRQIRGSVSSKVLSKPTQELNRE